MKKAMFLIVVVLAALIFSSCKMKGPVIIEGSYAGYFSVRITLRHSGVEAGFLDIPTGTYYREFDMDNETTEVVVTASKTPPDPPIPDQGDLGLLEIWLTCGDFGTLYGKAESGNMSDIVLQHSY